MAPGQNRHKQSNPSRSKDKDALGVQPRKPKSSKRKASPNDQKQSSKKKRGKVQSFSSSPSPGQLPASDFSHGPQDRRHMKKDLVKKGHLKKDSEDSDVKEEENKENNRPPVNHLPGSDEVNDNDASNITPQPVRSAPDTKAYPYLGNVQAMADFGLLADDQSILLLRSINKHVFEMRQEFREHWGLPRLDPNEEFAWSELEGGEDDGVMKYGI